MLVKLKQIATFFQLTLLLPEVYVRELSCPAHYIFSHFAPHGTQPPARSVPDGLRLFHARFLGGQYRPGPNLLT